MPWLRSATVRGKRFRLVRRTYADAAGHCEDPKAKSPTIHIPQDDRSQDGLRILIHEVLHAGCWDLSEEAVDEISRDAARLAWRLQWRRKP